MVGEEGGEIGKNKIMKVTNITSHKEAIPAFVSNYLSKDVSTESSLGRQGISPSNVERLVSRPKGGCFPAGHRLVRYGRSQLIRGECWPGAPQLDTDLPCVTPSCTCPAAFSGWDLWRRRDLDMRKSLPASYELERPLSLTRRAKSPASIQETETGSFVNFEIGQSHQPLTILEVIMVLRIHYTL